MNPAQRCPFSNARARPIAALDQELERRAFIKYGLTGLALTTGGCMTSIGVSRSRPYPLGMTDATIRPELSKDYAGTLRRLKDMGYSHFGFRLSNPNPADKTEPS